MCLAVDSEVISLCWSFSQGVQQEQSEIASQVSNLRDSAVEIMGKTTEYQVLVEPKLALLNEHWQQLIEKLKVSFHV